MKTFLAFVVSMVVLFSACYALNAYSKNQRYQQRERDIAGMTDIRSDEAPKSALKRAACQYGYSVLGEDSGHGMIAVPYTALPARKLGEWKKFSRETMHLHVTDLPGDIFQTYVSFDDRGEEIRGVDIDWFGETRTASFPYQLSCDETRAFVKSAIEDMALQDKIRENRK
jgi:hypothetical protein